MNDGFVPVPEEQTTEPQSGRSNRGKQLFYVAGIGASAGGLESLERFFDQMPSNSGMAFVVIQHLSPDYRSLMVELLSKHTSMAVMRAENGMTVEPDCVYLIPPRTSMTIQHGRLSLVEQDPNAPLHLPIDIFFRSLGHDQGEYAIGVILSGTGSDGMRGVRAIKDAGGMVMVQTMADAKFDGMPRSAISTGLADFVLPVDQMPQALLQFVQNPSMLTDGSDPSRIEEDHHQDLQRVVNTVRKHTGVDFTYYKATTVIRRVERRMSINQVRSLSAYADLLESDPKEVHTLHRELLIGVTKFFRDAEAFGLIRDKVIPSIFEQSQERGSIRVWVSGCSTGDEAYSLAMLLQEHMDRTQQSREIKVFATDIDKQAVEFAAEGTYPESIVADVSPKHLQRFFVKKKDHYQICRQIREIVIFAPQNIIKDPPFSNMDLVTCRNLLIYLQPTMQRKVMALLAYALKQNGYLFLGSSETPGNGVNVFKPVDPKWKIYQKVSTSRNLIGETLSIPPARSQEGSEGPLRSVALERSAAQASEPLLEKALQELMVSRNMGCMLLDGNYQLAHTFGRVTELIELHPGRASLDIRKMTSGELSSALATALSRASKSDQEVCYYRVDLRNRELRVNLRVRPFRVRRTDEPMYLVLLEQIESSAQEEPAAGGDREYNVSQEAQQRIEDLEQDLQFTKANLQATIEELQTSNEELQATNEELVTANEELQSTNEELQSVNEELHTVNTEYQEKIEELTQLNNDMDNLLRTTRIGTVFLDRRLNIRKFTPPVTDLLNVLAQDLGRPVSHITGIMSGDRLAELAQKTLDTCSQIDHEISHEEGSQYLVHFLPYLTENKQLEGVVITFIDVSEVKQAEANLRSVNQKLENILGSIDEVIWSVDLPSCEFTYFSPRVRDLLGRDPLELCGDQNLLWNAAVSEDRELLRGFLQRVQECQSDQQVVRFQRRNGDVVYVQLRGHLARDRQGQPSHINGVALNITDIREMQGRLQAAVDSLPEHMALLDADGTILMTNQSWTDIAADKEGRRDHHPPVGSSYLDALNNGEHARKAREGIQSVLDGQADAFRMKFPRGPDTEEDFFYLSVKPLNSPWGGAVVTHIELSDVPE